jgi:hypothetical protein
MYPEFRAAGTWVPGRGPIVFAVTHGGAFLLNGGCREHSSLFSISSSSFLNLYANQNILGIDIDTDRHLVRMDHDHDLGRENSCNTI